MDKTLQYLKKIGLSGPSRTKLLTIQEFLPHLEELLQSKGEVVIKEKVAVISPKRKKKPPMKAIAKCNVYTGEVMEAYRSISEAATDTGIDRKTITRALDSTTGVAKNFKWHKIIGFTRCIHCNHINITNKHGKIPRICEKCDRKMTFKRISNG